MCAVLLAFAIDSVGGHHRDLIAIFGPLIGAAFIGTGLLAWLATSGQPVRRADGRGGVQLLPVGTDRDHALPWTFIAGLSVIALPSAILFHILLAFPSGRLETRGNRALATAAYLVATVGWWLCMLFRSPPSRASRPTR